MPSKKRTAASAPAAAMLNRIKAEQTEGPPTTGAQVDELLAVEAQVEQLVDHLADPAAEAEQAAPPRPAISSPPANRFTAPADKPTVDGELTRCPRCGSTDRTSYTNRRELQHAGTTPAGRPFNLVVWRDTTCAECMQLRCDRHYEQTGPA